MQQKPGLNVANNWITYLGVMLAAGSFLTIVLILLVDFAGLKLGPYASVVTYMFLLALLLLGLVLIPVGMGRRRRQLAAAPAGIAPYPVLNLNDPRVRLSVGLFALVTVGIVVLLSTVTYSGILFADSVGFCGQVCHRIMKPEYTAYQHSSHARVECVRCHIGPGAPWFVRSKLSGTYQVIATLFARYPRPIPGPITSLRPARETCEECHWPGRFYGNKFLAFVTFGSDRDNTATTTPLLFKVGVGGEAGRGIHWHTAVRMWYYPLEESRRKVGLVEVEDAGEQMRRFVLPEASAQLEQIKAQSHKRLLDCIDCHNRAAHDIKPFASLVDDALRTGEIDPSMPYIKRGAVAAAPAEASAQFDLYEEVSSRIEEISGFYQREMPDYYEANREKVANAVKALKGLYARSSFSHMRVAPDTYPNWRSHDGCFRCHGALQEELSGQVIPAACNYCHEPMPQSTGTDGGG